MNKISNVDRRWDQGITRYPDPAIEIVDQRFAKYLIGNAMVEQLWTGARWSEGPVWFGDTRCLIWSDIPNNRMMRWTEETNQVTVFRQPANNSNGNTRDKQGRLITCEHLTRRVTRTGWVRPQARYTRGVLAKYAKSVSSASLGAVTDLD